MDNTRYAYAVANVRAKEVQLFDSRFFDRLTSVSNYEEAARILTDRGFTISDASDPENAFKNYMQETWDFLRSVAPDSKRLNFLIVKNDFHNLKAAIKGIMTGADAEKYFISPCIIEYDVMYDAVRNKRFSDLPKWIEKTAESGYELISSTMDGQMFDMLCDKASLEAMQEMAEDEFSKKIASATAALKNMKTALRMSKVKAPEVLYDYAFAQCEITDIEELKKASMKGTNQVVEYIASLGYEKLAHSAAKSAAEFEKESENYITSMLSDASRISLGIEPLIAYYYAREAECTNLRIITGATYSGFPINKAKERMRELYV